MITLRPRADLETTVKQLKVRGRVWAEIAPQAIVLEKSKEKTNTLKKKRNIWNKSSESSYMHNIPTLLVASQQLYGSHSGKWFPLPFSDSTLSKWKIARLWIRRGIMCILCWQQLKYYSHCIFCWINS